MKRFMPLLHASLLASYFFVGAADASVLLSGTRVIFPAEDGETTVRLTNQSPTPALVQAWIDSGDEHSTPDKAKAPFLITSSLFRMEPNRDQSVRILFNGTEQLPSDRESVFWFNMLEVPPKPSGPQVQGKNYLQLALRSRVKLFYRPAGLGGDSTSAPSKLSFKAGSEAGKGILVVHNPTPYYVTISQITLSVGGTPHKVDTGMVAPLSDLRVAVPGLNQAPSAGSTIKYGSINDYGSVSLFTGAID